MYVYVYMYLPCTYMHTYIPTYLHTYLHAYMRTYYISMYAHRFMLQHSDVQVFVICSALKVANHALKAYFVSRNTSGLYGG